MTYSTVITYLPCGCVEHGTRERRMLIMPCSTHWTPRNWDEIYAAAVDNTTSGE